VCVLSYLCVVLRGGGACCFAFRPCLFCLWFLLLLLLFAPFVAVSLLLRLLLLLVALFALLRLRGGVLCALACCRASCVVVVRCALPLFVCRVLRGVLGVLLRGGLLRLLLRCARGCCSLRLPRSSRSFVLFLRSGARVLRVSFRSRARAAASPCAFWASSAAPFFFFARWVGFGLASLLRVSSPAFLLVSSLFSVVASFAAVGFSGSRSSVVACSAARSVFPSVAAGASVFVGCAAGVDSAARVAFPSASVFRVASFPAPSFAASLALRSSACVRAVVAAGGLLVVCPSGPCPGSVRASGSWSSGGSGSWSSAALAVGLGGACLVCVPCSVAVPAWLRVRGGSCVGVVPFVGAWFFVPAAAPVAVALSLF
jgi:hypothetical protein